MQPGDNGSGRTNVFALVAYIPNPLGKYLDDLRCELVPDCVPRAHVTILPPRTLQAVETAWDEIRSLTRDVVPFTVSAGGIQVFPESQVIYLEVDEVARRQFHVLHQALNSGPMEFGEAFAYHPHVTLAQDLRPEQVPEMLDRANRLWHAYPGKRDFLIDSMTLVRTEDGKRWVDLAKLILGAVPVVR